MKRRTTIQSPAAVRRTTSAAAQQAFLQHCKIRNLAPQTLVYYTENLRYLFQKVQVDYVDEISQATFDDFLGAELDDTKKVISLNSRMRGLRGVSKASIHLFRHCFAKNFILASGGMVQLQALLGHSSLDTTRHYVNIYGLDLQRDFDRLNPLDTFWKIAANQ